MDRAARRLHHKAKQASPLEKCGKTSLYMKYNCPICEKQTDSEKDSEFPFCSERCRLLDLGAWASEKYVVTKPIFDEEDIPEPDRRLSHDGRRRNMDRE
jgi:uncharacterized protein